MTKNVFDVSVNMNCGVRKQRRRHSHIVTTRTATNQKHDFYGAASVLMNVQTSEFVQPHIAYDEASIETPGNAQGCPNVYTTENKPQSTV